MSTFAHPPLKNLSPNPQPPIRARNTLSLALVVRL